MDSFNNYLDVVFVKFRFKNAAGGVVDNTLGGYALFLPSLADFLYKGHRYTNNGRNSFIGEFRRCDQILYYRNLIFFFGFLSYIFNSIHNTIFFILLKSLLEF